MKLSFVFALLIVTANASLAAGQSAIHARTDAGKDVILQPDGTWEYAPVRTSRDAASPSADVHIERLSMAKDNKGAAGEITNSFKPSERKVHCIVDLNRARRGTRVKLVWKAVDVEGAPNQDIKTVVYVTKPRENKVHGWLILPRNWPKGSYEVEVYIEGVLEKTIGYSIQ